MPSVHINDVPADFLAERIRRAAAAGILLQSYLLARLTEEARTPSLEDVFPG